MCTRDKNMKFKISILDRNFHALCHPNTDLENLIIFFSNPTKIRQFNDFDGHQNAALTRLTIN